MRAIVLSAGFATRMRPLSDHIPKPLLPILGKPLLERILDNLSPIVAKPVVVNTHHLAGKIADFVSALPDPGAVRLSHEPEILGSGGALVLARETLTTDGDFIYHNGDELTDIDIQEVVHRHGAVSPLATLALTDHGPENRVLVSENGEVLDIVESLGIEPPPGSRTLAFTGIAAISNRVFDHLPPEGPSSVMKALLKGMREDPGCVRAYVPEGIYWSNVEDIGRYLEVHKDILIDGKLRINGSAKEGIHICEGADISPRARLSGFVSVGPGAVVMDDAVLEDCVVFGGAVVPVGKAYSRTVISPDFIARAPEG